MNISYLARFVVFLCVALTICSASIVVLGTAQAQTGNESAQKIANLLKKAQQARAAGHLVAPAGNNAAEFYADVLRLDPSNKEARERLTALRAALEASLLAARKKNDAVEIRRVETIQHASETFTFGDGKGATPGPPPPRPHIPVANPMPPPNPSESQPMQSQPKSAAALENDVDKLIQKLPTGNIAFNVPQAMKLNDTQLVHVVLSGSAAPEDLRKKVTEDGIVEVDRLKISDDLEIHLTGAAFKIKAITPERQAVGNAHTSEWQWQVTPTESGAQELALTVSVIFRIDKEDRSASVTTFDRKIDVQVDWSNSFVSFFQSNWQWLWTAILVPITLLALKNFKKVGKRKSKRR